jgi:uncharacterized protein YjdB
MAATIEVGGSVQLTATVDGGAAGVTWQSSAADVATVSQNGEVIGVAEGVAVITAKSVVEPAKLATANITVYQGEVKSVEIDPDPALVVRGTTTQLAAQAFNGFGAPVMGRLAAWAIDDPLIATVEANGLITAVSFGTTQVTATIDGASARGTIVVGVGHVTNVIIQPATMVLGEGDQMTFTARPLDVAGNLVAQADVHWSTSDPAIATVSELGVVTAVSLGNVTITARAQNAEGKATVSVVAPVIASIQISPRPAVLEEGDFVQLSAIGKDGSGAPLTLPVTWKSSAPAAATVSQNGLVTGVSASSTPVLIVASAAVSATRTIADTIALTIVPASVASIVTTVPQTTIEVGETVQAKAVMFDKRGNILTDRYCDWETDNAAVVSVDEHTGKVVGLAVGDAIITATSGGVIGTTIIHVVQAEVASVVLTPTSLGLFVGQSMGLTLEVRDKRGGLIAGRPVTWSTSDAKIAGVDTKGVVTGNNAGSATVSATVGTLKGTANVIVSWSTDAVASVLVQLGKNALDVGQTTTATAVLFNALGYRLTGRAVTWASSNPAVASVNRNTGLVTAVGQGTAYIRATSEGITGEALMSVTSQPWVVGDHHPLVDLTLGAREIGVAGSGQMLAQTFTPNDDRWLGYISLPVFCPAGGTLTVTIRDGLDGPALYSANLTGLPSIKDGTLRMIQLFNPTISSTGIRLTGGREYVIELSSPTAASLGSCGISRAPASVNYPHGASYRREGTGPWISLGPTEDLPFRTYIRH